MLLKRYILSLLACLSAAAVSAAQSDTVRMEICAGEEIVLRTKASGDSCHWSTGATQTAIRVQPTKTDTFVAETYTIGYSMQNNLMANGDFESGYIQFQSDYNLVSYTGKDYYDSHGGANNLFVLTGNANHFWRDFYPIYAHSGTYFALFDAGTSGFAWKTNTQSNPRLVIQKDSVYLFSFWAAYPNQQRNQSPAVLQWVIEYVDVSGQTQRQNLGQPYTLGQNPTPNHLNDWEQYSTTWKAPASSNQVLIGVYDLNTSGSGNDFCLDDIMFQQTSMIQVKVIHEDVYVVEVKDCNPPPPPVECVDDYVMRKWTNVLFVNNGPTGLNGRARTYQWMRDGRAIAGAQEQFLYEEQGLDGLLQVVVTLDDGSQITTCPKKFEDFPCSNVLNAGTRGALVSERIYQPLPMLYIVRREYENGDVTVDKIWQIQ